MSRATYKPGSLDLALEYLRGHGLPYRWSEHDIRTWEAVCPHCHALEWALRIREPRRGGPISLYCRSGCTTDEIRTALEAEPVEPRVEQALLLAEQARDIAEQALALAICRCTEAVLDRDNGTHCARCQLPIGNDAARSSQ
jgi:hypothetical protein